MIHRHRLEPAGNPPGENDFLPLGVDYIRIDTVDDWQAIASEHREQLCTTFGSLFNAYRRLVSNGAIRVGGNGAPETSIYLRPECDQPDDEEDDEEDED